jgi:hypothetical protein
MDVFLVPVGNDAYELYSEEIEEPPTDESAEPPRGFFQRLKFRFTEMLAEAERDRRRGVAARADGGFLQRVKRRIMRWVAESIAEQMLLWKLRREPQADFYYPDDLTEDGAVAVRRRQLSRDFDKHRYWLAIDSVLMIAAGLLFWIPGPNVLGYYFAFRVVGHYFSLRGARNGLNAVTWTHHASAPLTELRRALQLDPSVRLQRVEDVAMRLRLDHLATFFQRMATS